MTDINLEDYQLNQEILNQEDYVLELWYGKAGLFFIKELRRIDNIKEDGNYIIDYINLINGQGILRYCSNDNTLYFDFRIECKFSNIYNLNYQQMIDLIEPILKQTFNFRIDSIL
jgi:hypothetical protein